VTPHHHVSEELLTAYAAGAAPEAIALFVASHASLCAACRARLADEEAVGGVLLGALPPTRRDDLLARTLARLDEPGPAPLAPAPRHNVFPSPVMRLLGAEPVWRRVVPGLDVAELPVALNGQPAVLTRLAPGTVVPSHTHSGWELQLVLSGGYQADDGRFDRGDAHCADPAVSHGFRVDADRPCVSLLVREARIVPKTLLGRVFGWITGA
jgi:putative transcriptional regulator